jgi:hypothetical protein
MSLPSKREYLNRIHGRYQRAGRLHKSRILDEFCAIFGYHRKAALRLLNRSLLPASRHRPGPQPTYLTAVVLPPLGDPAPNAPKWFAAVEMIRLAADRDWLYKATKEVAKFWRCKRERRQFPEPLSNTTRQRAG